MTTTPHRQRRGVPRWGWALVALVVVGALVAGISALFSSNRASTEAPSPPAPSLSVATSDADGCIAGRDNDAKNLIAGAHEQPQSEAGAAAVAAGQMRFMFQYPWPEEEELTRMIGELWTVTSSEDAERNAQAIRSQEGPESARTAGASFADARYIVETDSTSERARISVAAQGVTDNQLNGSSTSMTFALVWKDDVWKLDEITTPRTAEDVLANGTAFVGGC